MKKVVFLVLALLLTLTACKANICVLQYSAEAGGKVVGETEQRIFQGENGKPVTAVANDGYEFVGWSDGVTTAERQDKSASGDVTVTAKFNKLPDPHLCDSVCATCGKCLNKDCVETACQDKCECPDEPAHTCESKCLTCGKCTNADCTEEACSAKCACVVTPPHMCESVCATCGKCLNKDCVETACQDKCTCVVEPPVPEHACTSICEKCGKCKNMQCNHSTCTDKCDCKEPTHTCDSKCKTCNGCTNADCAEEECLTKCTCVVTPPHACESVCPTCGKCLNKDCEESACQDKCTCIVEPPIPEHTCTSKCETCGKCTNTQCDKSACINKCDCPDDPTHFCESKCETCGNCTNLSCTDPVCSVKCICAGPPAHICESRCPVCDKCQNENCFRPECSTKCDCLDEPAHTCESKCLTCGKCTNANCTEEVCSAKCTCVEPHICRHVCYLCGGCRDVNCQDEVCSNKCTCHTVTYVYDVYISNLSGKQKQLVAHGQDGTAVTASAKWGYQFWYWSDAPENTGAEYATRQETNVTEDKTVTAVFRPCSYTYVIEGDYGKFVYNGQEGREFEIFRNDDWTFDEITAINADGYCFYRWSDYSTSATRKDTDYYFNTKTIYAHFVKGQTVTYNVHNDFGGKIIGNTYQNMILAGTDGEPVTAVADEGYIFLGWSDLNTNNTRYETAVPRDEWYTAFFELTEKTFSFNYNGANQPLQTSITLNRNNLIGLQFPVPQRVGYTFCGWYLDDTYTTKVADENGKYYLGLIPFSIEDTTVIAKWKDNSVEETVPVYKVLLTMVDAIQCSLWSSETQGHIDVDYKMPAVTRQILRIISLRFGELLNDWFEGRVIFDVDTYYTTETLSVESQDPNNWDGERSDYDLYVYDVPEVLDIYTKYNSTLLVHGFNDFEHYLHRWSGNTTYKHGSVSLDSQSLEGEMDDSNRSYKFFMESNPEQIMQEYSPWELKLFMHEFCHTIELQNHMDSYHYVDSHISVIGVNKDKVFLLDKAKEYGDYEGIPSSFWETVWKK